MKKSKLCKPSNTLTSLIAVTSAWAVGSECFSTMLWQLTTTSSLQTTTAPNGPPSPHSIPWYASPTAFDKNLWSLSWTTTQTIECCTKKEVEWEQKGSENKNEKNAKVKLFRGSSFLALHKFYNQQMVVRSKYVQCCSITFMVTCKCRSHRDGPVLRFCHWNQNSER